MSQDSPKPPPDDDATRRISQSDIPDLHPRQPPPDGPRGSGPQEGWDGSGGRPGYVPPPGSGAQPGYVPPPGSGAQPGYGPPPGSGAQPGYGPPPGYMPPPGQAPPPPYGSQPGHGAAPPPGYGYGQQPPSGYGQPGHYGPPQQGPPYVPGTYGPRPRTDDTTMAMLAHLLGLLVSWVGPLIIYLMKKDESPYVRDQAAEALNFQITMFIGYIVAALLSIVLIGLFLFPIIWIVSLIFHIQAAMAANRGANYRYPMTIRMIS